MRHSLTIPPPEEIARRIELCTKELAQLRKLYRMAMAAQAAEAAAREREARQPEALLT